jgi:1,2-diacylglycerol 3-alpha-glucosyltransferase
MNIAVFTDSFLPHVSGVSSAVINQANELARQGHQVMIFRPKAFGTHAKRKIERSGELAAKIRDVQISLPSLRQPGLRIAIPTVAPNLPTLKKFKPDVVHVHTEWGCGWEGVMLAKMLRKPLVGTFHTFFAEPEYLKQFHLPNHRLTQEMMWRYSVFFYNHCDRILSPSRSVAQQLTDRGAEKIPHLMSNGIPQYAWVDEAAIREERRKMGIGEEFVFVYVGRLSEEKSLPVLLRAFRELAKHRADAKLVIIGDGPQRKELEDLAGTLKLGNQILFTGSIPHVELVRRNLPRIGQVFVTASKTENQPVSLLEAMSFGVPLIGPEAKGIPELVRHELTGLLFPPDDGAALTAAMLRMMGEEELRQSCGNNAQTLAGENSITSIVNQLVFHYQQTIDSRRTRKRRRSIRRLRSRARFSRP